MEQDEIAYEVRSPWTSADNDGYTGAQYGRVGDLYLGQRLVALWKGTTVVNPHPNALGEYTFGTCGVSQCDTTAVYFIGSRLDPFGRDVNPPASGSPNWWGSIITGQTDASGLLFRGNRYVDPVTGSFTQSDPIGIGGGLNTYGYVGGDPVNFSDPLGLYCLGKGSKQRVPCKVSAKGKEFIEKHEGFSHAVYNDNGKPAIGYGHDIGPGESFTTINREQAATLMNADLVQPLARIDKLNMAFSQNQVDALADLFYNAGPGIGPKLQAGLNSGHVSSVVPSEWQNIDLSNGHVDPVLVQRRLDEINLFLHGVYR